MILVYDTETSGLVQKSLPPDHPAQPHLVQLGLVALDENFTEVQCARLTVRPDGWTIPDGAVKSHGITTEMATAVGVPLITALAVFTQLRAIAGELVAHNLDFDESIIATAIARSGRRPAHPGPPRRTCTMRLAAPVLKLPPTAKMLAAGMDDRYKAPSLTECYERFFPGEAFAAHDALADARACARVYVKLKELTRGD